MMGKGRGVVGSVHLGGAVVAAAAALAPGAAPPGAQQREWCSGELVSPSFGVVHCGERVYANDRGAWREITPPRMRWALHDVVFLDRLNGWVATNDCTAGRAFVHRTRDGGRTWLVGRVRSTNCAAGSRLELAFADQRHGWLERVFLNGNSQHLERSIDGGATWAPLPLLPAIGAIVFRTRHEGWIGRSDFARLQQLHATRDGGRTWRRRVLPPPRGWGGARVFPDAPRFFGRRGVLPVDLVAGSRVAVAFYVTADGGRSWRVAAVRRAGAGVTRPRLPFVYYVPVSVATARAWWIADGRTIHLTADGGRRWTTSVPKIRPRPLRRSLTVSGADARRAWVAGDRLVETRDGGRSWRVLEPR